MPIATPSATACRKPLALIAPPDTARQVHQSAALRVYRQTVIDGAAQRFAQTGVGAELLHAAFRKATADKQAVDGRQPRVP